MKKNPLTLLGAASVALVLTACGGGSDTVVDTAPIPASFNGAWAYTQVCQPTFGRASAAGGGTYYGGSGILMVNSAASSASDKNLVYNDAQCTSKAGAVTYTYTFSQTGMPNLNGYLDARSGVLTHTSTTMNADDDGTGLSLASPAVSNGGRGNFVAGLKNGSTLCLDSGPLGSTPDIAQGLCGVRR